MWLVRVPRAAMVLCQGVPTVVCTLGNLSRPRWPVPVRSPSPRRPSPSTPTPSGKPTPCVPCARPTETVWIPPSQITSLRVPTTSEKYYVTMKYVGWPRACDTHTGPVGKWFSLSWLCDEKNSPHIIKCPPVAAMSRLWFPKLSKSSWYFWLCWVWVPCTSGWPVVFCEFPKYFQRPLFVKFWKFPPWVTLHYNFKFLKVSESFPNIYDCPEFHFCYMGLFGSHYSIKSKNNYF